MNKEPKPFTDVTLNTEITRSIAEHEVFMSFVNDYDAVAFHDWWHEEGAVLFNDWRFRQ